VAANVSGLTASTTYHLRIVATNSSGTTYGSDSTFTTLSATGPPVVITNPATLIASFSGALNGSVDPHGTLAQRNASNRRDARQQSRFFALDDLGLSPAQPL
jgi:hypothetical protein